MKVMNLSLSHKTNHPNDLRSLFEKWAPAATSWLQSRGINKASAEDIVQDIFTAMAKRPNDLPRKPSAYIFRAARNALSHLSKKPTVYNSVLQFESAQRGPDYSQIIAEELNKLSIEQRDVVVLKFWHQMTFNEISEAINIPRTTAADRFKAGMQVLEKNLRQYFD
ncbi:RNA polymerase sigma factor [Planctomycetota bacterium]